MPAEKFMPMPESEPEELPREKTQYNIPAPPGEIQGEKTKIMRLDDVSKARKGPPPIPMEALGIEELPELDETVEELAPEPMRFVKLEDVKKGPPPIPEAVRKASIEAARKRMEHIQENDVVEAFEVLGIDGLNVAATMEKKDERKGSPENRNEDNVLIDPETGIIGVLDGLGGVGEKGAGALASKAAELVIPEAYKEAKREIATLDNQEVQSRLVEQQLRKIGNPEKRGEVTVNIEGMFEIDPKMAKEALALVESVRSANDAVKETGGKTTATITKIHRTPDGRQFALIANLGDSAAYKQSADGSIEAITEEDSSINSLKRAGVLTEELLNEMKRDKNKKYPIPLSLSVIQALGGGEEQLKQFQEKDMTHLPLSYEYLNRAMVASLGSEVFEPTLKYVELKPGESVFMATDGQMDIVEDEVTGEFDDIQVLKDMAGKLLPKAFNPDGTVNMDKLRALIPTIPLKDRLNHMRDAAARSKKKDDDVAIVGAAVA